MKKSLTLLLLASAVLGSAASAAPTKITWHGHAAFEITTPKGTVLMIDPWLSNPVNPQAQGGKNPVADVKKLDYILITHGHSDHVGDAVALGKKTKAKLISTYELGGNLVSMMGFPKAQADMTTMINPGGEIQVADGEVTVAMTPAIHGSGLTDKKGNAVYGGVASGFVVKIKEGPTLYHTGDTAYFTDMKLIGEKFAPDVALVNIGGHFGMEPDMAIEAAVASKAKIAIPMHFKTFPILTQSPDGFVKGVKDKGAQALVMTPGETIEFEGKELKKK